MNQNKIPQKWIQKENYKILLNKVINPNFVKYAQNYIDHNNKNKVKKDLIILKKMTEIKTPIFSTYTLENKSKNKAKENPVKNINKSRSLGKSLKKILSYQGLNTKSINAYPNTNRIMENKNIKYELRSIPTEINILKRNDFNSLDNKIYNNIKRNNLKKNCQSLDNVSLRQPNKLTLPKIKRKLKI